jgi:hypothetical protein
MLYKTQHIINNNLINLSYNNLETIVKYIPQKPIEKKPIYDKNDDFLFWIFFIFVKGEMEFEYIKKQKYTIAQEFKINASLKIKKTKFNNRKLVKSKILNNMCHEKKISLMTLAALCFIYEINILYCVNDVKYYNLGDNYIEEINILINDHGTINFIKNATKEDIEKYTQNTIKMESFEEKLKSLSSYKLSDLHNIANILKISVKNKPKQTIYNEIQKIL